MKTEEAKSILQGYRPNGADAGDPAFGEALALVRTDPALREWFAREQAFDHAMSAEFEAVPAPAGLRDGILTAARAAAPATLNRSWWRNPLPLGLAAAGVLLLVSITLALRPGPKLPAADSALADFAIGDAQHPKTHGGHGDEAAELNHMLNLPATRLGRPLPMDFAALRDTGCRIVKVEGRDVLEVCFKRSGVGLHYYIARQQDFPALTAPAVPAVADKGIASIATWADAANLYIVVTKPDRSVLEKLL